MRKHLAAAALAVALACGAAAPAIAETAEPALEETATPLEAAADTQAEAAEEPDVEPTDVDTPDAAEAAEAEADGEPDTEGGEGETSFLAVPETATAAGTATFAKPVLSFSAHVQNVGWMKDVAVAPGATGFIGTTGRSLRLEALRFSVAYPAATATETAPSGTIEARWRTEGAAWSGWAAPGAAAGSQGRALRLEGVALRLTGTLGTRYDLYYRVHLSGTGWTAWTLNGSQAGCAGQGRRIEAVEVRLVEKDAPASSRPATGVAWTQTEGVSYRTHVQNLGWTARVSNGAVSGTSGRALRMEAFDARLDGFDVPGGVRYAAHVQNVGWQGWSSDGAATGTTGRALRMEALKMELTGQIARTHDIYYRAHVQNFGWLDWARNGEVAGSYGLALRVEAFQVKVVAKGTDPGLSTARPFVATPALLVSTTGRGQEAGAWTQGVSGTTGKSLPLTSFSAKTAEKYGMAGGVAYRVNGSGHAWSAWASDGAAAGGSSVHAVEMKLTGDLASRFDVWYRVHLSGSGWLGWAKNGQSAGTLDTGRTVEAVEARIVSKSASAPGPNWSFLYVGSSAALSARVMQSAARTASPPEGWCARWITNVYSGAGLGYVGGNANDMYRRYATSADRAKLVPGMVVAVPTHELTRAGRVWGHIGIYAGGGQIMDSVGYVRTMPLDAWIATYGTVAQVRWGFA